MSKLFFLDTETTGLTLTDRLCQLAYRGEGWTDEQEINELYCPPVDIGVEAMSVHHITTAQVREKPAFIDSKEYAEVKRLFKLKTNILVAHNAQFDIGMLKKEGIEVKSNICTQKVARYLYEKEGKIKSFALQKLRYGFDLQFDGDAKAHDASGDIKVLEALFWHLYNECETRANAKAQETGRKKYTRDEILKRMMDITEQPISPDMRMPFGKYKDEMIKEAVKKDPRYFDWLLSQKDGNTFQNRDLVATINYWKQKHGL